MSGAVAKFFAKSFLDKPWIWSYIGAVLVWLAAIFFTRGYGAGGMVTAALSLAVFTVVVGIGQMFVISLGPGNVDLSLPANIGLASAVAMKVMAGDDSLVVIGLFGALYGISMAGSQRDLKRVLAYSSVENIGLITLGVGLGFWGIGCLSFAPQTRVRQIRATPA